MLAHKYLHSLNQPWRISRGVPILLRRYLGFTQQRVLRTEIIRPWINPTWLPNIKRLLYEVYVEEQKWKFGSGTPSSVLVDHNNRLLKDKFMETSTWFVLLTGHGVDADVVGCVRLIENVPAEVFGYADSAIGGTAIKTIQRKYGANGVVEMNRWAVSHKARTPDFKVAVDLLLAVYRYIALRNDDDRPLVATVACNSWVPGFMDKIPGVGETQEVVGDPFFFEETDREPVQLYITSRESIKKSARKYLVYQPFNNALPKTPSEAPTCEKKMSTHREISSISAPLINLSTAFDDEEEDHLPISLIPPSSA